MRMPLAALLSGVTALAAAAQSPAPYLEDPVGYERDAEHNPVAELQRALAAGDTELRRDAELGLLPALLAALEVPASSQTLVFSKTSFQNDRITRRRPRAVYFGDRAYVGYVPGSTVLEVSAVDAERGAVFYTVTDDGSPRPRIERDDASCLQCHAFRWTRDMPGHLVRSVFTAADGMPLQRFGSNVVNHDTPYAERWGGWYVTGRHGAMQHRGNVVLPPDAERPELPPGGRNVTDLGTRIDADRYPSPHSDLVALLVLEHQTWMHNLLAWANHRATLAIHRQRGMNRALDVAEDERSDTTRDQLHALADEILRYLLFRDEPPLPAPIEGSSDFAREFAARGPHDAAGRSLRSLDLQTRLFRWPCSYVIQGEAFAALHPEVKDVVLLRLYRILARGFGRRTYRHLTREDRTTILAILRDTMPDLPEYWRRTTDDR